MLKNKKKRKKKKEIEVGESSVGLFHNVTRSLLGQMKQTLLSLPCRNQCEVIHGVP